VNAPLDAAISGGVAISPLVINAVHQCMNRMMFASPEKEYVAVPLGPAARTCTYGGLNQDNLLMIGLLAAPMNGVGAGAKPGTDGIDSCGFWWAGMADSMDCEHDELLLPFVHVFRKLPLDQAGLGKYRGGVGVSSSIVIHKSPMMFITPLGQSWRFPADRGLFGGYAGGVAPAVKIAGADWKRKFKEAPDDIPSDFHQLVVDRKVKGQYSLKVMQPGEPYFEGESFTVASISGSGYGDVLERDPKRVMTDLKSGIISDYVAKNVYHVVYDPDTLEADSRVTEKAREEERKDRMRRGRPYDEFEKEWLAKKPPEQALKHYGRWPDPSEKG
jgi:acetophenone carboxylase